MTPHEVVGDRWSGRLSRSALAFLGGGGPQAMLTTQTVHPGFAHTMAQHLDVICQEAIAQGGLITVQVHEVIDEIGVIDVSADRPDSSAIGSRAGERALEPRRSTEPGNPRRLVHGPAGISFWEGLFGEIGRGSTQDLIFHLESTDISAQLNHFSLLG